MLAGSASTWARTFRGLRGTSSSSELPSSPSLFLRDGGLCPNFIPCAICFCFNNNKKNITCHACGQKQIKDSGTERASLRGLTCRFLTLSDFSWDMSWSRPGSVTGSSGIKMLSCERARDPMGFNSLQEKKESLALQRGITQSVTHSVIICWAATPLCKSFHTNKWATSLHCSSLSASIKKVQIMWSLVQDIFEQSLTLSYRLCDHNLQAFMTGSKKKSVKRFLVPSLSGQVVLICKIPFDLQEIFLIRRAAASFISNNKTTTVTLCTNTSQNETLSVWLPQILIGLLIVRHDSVAHFSSRKTRL